MSLESRDEIGRLKLAGRCSVDFFGFRSADSEFGPSPEQLFCRVSHREARSAPQ